MSASYPDKRFPELRYVSVAEVDELIKSPATVVFDVRVDGFEAGHVSGAQNVPSTGFAERAQELAQASKGHKQAIFYCGHSANRGPTCAQAFFDAGRQVDGFATEVLVMSGGYAAYDEAHSQTSSTGHTSEDK